MKQFCVFLLVCIISAPAAAVYISVKDDCNKPHKVFKEWAENSCATGKVADFVASHAQNDLQEAAEHYCSSVKAEVETCFRNIIKDKCPDKEEQLMGYAEQTGAICDKTAVRQVILDFLATNPFEDKTSSPTCKTALDGVEKVVVPNDEDDFDIFFQKAETEFNAEIDKIVTAAENCEGSKAWQAFIRVIFDSDIKRPEPYGLEFSDWTTDKLSEWFNIS